MHFSLSGTKTREQTKLMLDNILLSYQNLRRGLYAVIHKQDRKLIGYCGFFSQEIDGKEEVEVGYLKG
jgi:[ribosomal protein S5]-alanine N-acetyltransferase